MRRRKAIGLIGSMLGSGCLRTAMSENQSTPSGETRTTTAANSTPKSTTDSEGESEHTQTATPTAEVEKVWEASHGTTYIGNHHHLDNSFVVGNPNSSFARLTRADGSVMWKQSIAGGKTEVSTSSSVTQGQVVLGGQKQFSALDVETGEVTWQTDIPAQASKLYKTTTESVVAEGVVLFSFDYSLEDGTDRAGLAGLDVNTGELLWKKTHNEISSKWDSWLGVQSLSPPIAGRTIVGGWNNSFWIDIKTGTFGEDTWAGARYDSVRVEDHLYLTNTGKLHSWQIVGDSVKQEWTFDPLGRASSQPVARDETVYFAADDTGIYAVRNGKQKWRFQAKGTVRQAPAVTNSRVWAGDSNLYVLDRATGQNIATASNIYPQVLSATTETAFVSNENKTAAYRVVE